MNQFNAIFGTEAAKEMTKAISETTDNINKLRAITIKKARSIGISRADHIRNVEDTLERYKKNRGI